MVVIFMTIGYNEPLTCGPTCRRSCTIRHRSR